MSSANLVYSETIAHMINQPMFDQDEDVLLMNPDPETAALDDDDDDDFDGGAEFDELGSGATSGYGEADLADVDEEFGDDDLSEELDEDDIEDDLDDDIN
jgi:DNA-directed RNA polymerase subunit delta